MESYKTYVTYYECRTQQKQEDVNKGEVDINDTLEIRLWPLQSRKQEVHDLITFCLNLTYVSYTIAKFKHWQT